jgi:hypothetical protein
MLGSFLGLLLNFPFGEREQKQANLALITGVNYRGVKLPGCQTPDKLAGIAPNAEVFAAADSRGIAPLPGSLLSQPRRC